VVNLQYLLGITPVSAQIQNSQIQPKVFSLLIYKVLKNILSASPINAPCLYQNTDLMRMQAKNGVMPIALSRFS